MKHVVLVSQKHEMDTDATASGELADLPTSAGAAVASRDVEAASGELLRVRSAQNIAAGALAVYADGVDRPGLIVSDPAHGSVVIDIAATAHDPADPGTVRALDDEPIDLIWAPSLIWAQSWDEQAAGMAWEISHMIGPGKREHQDIAVLVTQRGGTFKRIQAALHRVNVSYVVVTRENAAPYDLSSPEVTVMAVHATKGYGFDVLVLLGLEAFPNPVKEPEAAQQANVCFVGMTRARDQLLVMYTRDNPYPERRRLCPDVSLSVGPDNYKV